MPYHYDPNKWLPNATAWKDDMEALPSLDDEARPYYPESDGVRSKGRLTAKQLELYADRLLWADRCERRKETNQAHAADDGVLFPSQMNHRRRIEVFNEAGVADPEFTVNSNGQRGMYWRNAPEGRQVASVEARKLGAAYYAHT